MAKVDVCVGTFSELSAWGRLAGSIRNCGEIQPLTYLCFSSSFICSAKSSPAPLLVPAASGVAPLDAGAVFESFVRLAALFSEEPGTTTGELAILWLTGGVGGSGECYDIPARVYWCV